MEETISRYKQGSKSAKDTLIESILDLHNYNISKEEAIILLYKKYGKTEIF